MNIINIHTVWPIHKKKLYKRLIFFFLFFRFDLRNSTQKEKFFRIATENEIFQRKMKLNPKKKRKKKCCRENNSNKKKCKKRLNEIFLKIHLCVYFVVGSVFFCYEKRLSTFLWISYVRFKWGTSSGGIWDSLAIFLADFWRLFLKTIGSEETENASQNWFFPSLLSIA